MGLFSGRKATPSWPVWGSSDAQLPVRSPGALSAQPAQPQSPASSDTTSLARGPIPCVTLAEQGRPCPHLGSRATQRPRVTGKTAQGSLEVRSTPRSQPRRSCWTAHTCVRAQGLGRGHCGVHVGHTARKGLLGRQSQALGRPGWGTRCWSCEMLLLERGRLGWAGQPAAGGAEHTASRLEGCSS